MTRLQVHRMFKPMVIAARMAICLMVFSLAACSPGQLMLNLIPGSDKSVLFKDNFSTISGGWSTQRNANSIIDFEKGGFRIWVNRPNYDYWSVPGLRFTDVSIEVTAAKLAGPDDNDFGIICRYQDQDNFYGFLISSDGYYGISKRKNGDHTIISGQEMKPSSAIHTGAATNTIRADCIGSTLTLYVNQVKLVEVTDTDYAMGDVGLLAGSFAQPGVDILFNDFVVRKPG